MINTIHLIGHQLTFWRANTAKAKAIELAEESVLVFDRGRDYSYCCSFGG